MLSKAVQSIRRIERLETVGNKVYTGEAKIDRKMNVEIENVLVRGTEIRYIVLSDEETERIVENMQERG